jgi:hypothetical protein
MNSPPGGLSLSHLLCRRPSILLQKLLAVPVVPLAVTVILRFTRCLLPLLILLAFLPFYYISTDAPISSVSK